MLTIDVKTKAIQNKHEHPKVMVQTPFGIMDQTPGYIRGWLKPNYPVPVVYETYWQSFWEHRIDLFDAVFGITD